MVADAIPSRIDQKWQYRVRIQNLTIGHFNAVSSIEAEFDITEYHQGGDVDPAVQTPGKRKHTAVTLSAGSSEIMDLWLWWREVKDNQNRGLPVDKLRRQVFIDTLAADGETVLQTKTLNRALPQKFVAGEYDASSSDNVIQSMTVVYKNLDIG